MNAQLKAVGDIDRKTYLGSSDIAALMNIDPYDKTPLTVYQAKRGEREGITDPDKLLFLARRKRWEPVVVQMLREEFDGEIVAVNQRYEDPEYPFLAAEIDFEWRDPVDGSVQNGEIKTVSQFAFNKRLGWGAPGTDEIPLHYTAQTMYGLGITRRRTTMVAALAGLDSMTFYRTERDDEAIAAMRDVAVNFWNDHVLPGVPPEPSTREDVMALFARHRGCPVDLDEPTALALTRLTDLRAQMKADEFVEAELELEIAKYVCNAWGIGRPEESKDNAILRYDGREICKWAAGRGAHLDQQRLAFEHPEIKAQYMVPHYFRSFRFPKGEGA